jgi:hypothetical protein
MINNVLLSIHKECFIVSNNNGFIFLEDFFFKARNVFSRPINVILVSCESFNPLSLAFIHKWLLSFKDYCIVILHDQVLLNNKLQNLIRVKREVVRIHFIGAHLSLAHSDLNFSEIIVNLKLLVIRILTTLPSLLRTAGLTTTQ